MTTSFYPLCRALSLADYWLSIAPKADEPTVRRLPSNTSLMCGLPTDFLEFCSRNSGQLKYGTS
jgi:hypothetical protein